MTGLRKQAKVAAKDGVQSFHLNSFPANDAWPQGGWSLYQINGDQIAMRVKFGRDGKVSERHPWCGFIGCFATLEQVMEAIRG